MKSNSHPRDFPIAIGQRVESQDGEALGHIKELTATHFKVDIPRARDRWLARAAVATVEGDAVCLSFDEEQLDGLWVDEPVALAADPDLASMLETFEDTADERARRAAQGAGRL